MKVEQKLTILVVAAVVEPVELAKVEVETVKMVVAV
jgi:hypothetical protein